jgi:hypothetical protein
VAVDPEIVRVASSIKAGFVVERKHASDYGLVGLVQLVTTEEHCLWYNTERFRGVSSHAASVRANMV